MAVEVLRKGVVPPPEAAICPTCNARVPSHQIFSPLTPPPPILGSGYPVDHTLQPVDAIFSCNFCGCVWKWVSSNNKEVSENE